MRNEGIDRVLLDVPKTANRNEDNSDATERRAEKEIPHPILKCSRGCRRQPKAVHLCHESILLPLPFLSQRMLTCQRIDWDGL